MSFGKMGHYGALGLRISVSLGGDAGRDDPRGLLDAGRPEGRSDTSGVFPAVPFWSESRERRAWKSGMQTLRAVRKHLRDNHLDDPQRAYWRDAQRRHRAVRHG